MFANEADSRGVGERGSSSSDEFLAIFLRVSVFLQSNKYQWEIERSF